MKSAFMSSARIRPLQTLRCPLSRRRPQIRSSRKCTRSRRFCRNARSSTFPAISSSPSKGTNSDAALHTENASITAASDSLTSVSLTGYEIVKLVKASRASSEMALSAFESYIVEVIAESIARKIENYIFTGTGSDQPGGVKVA